MPLDILLSRDNSTDFWPGFHPLVNELEENAKLRPGSLPFPSTQKHFSEYLSCSGHCDRHWGEGDAMIKTQPLPPLRSPVARAEAGGQTVISA